MNMMDRFLSLVKVKRNQLQLLGTVCLFLSSKIKESPPLDPTRLVFYTDCSITLEEIRVSREMAFVDAERWMQQEEVMQE